jgi:hypothetical protein
VQATSKKASAAEHPIVIGRLIFMRSSIWKVNFRNFTGEILSLAYLSARISYQGKETMPAQVARKIKPESANSLESILAVNIEGHRIN